MQHPITSTATFAHVMTTCSSVANGANRTHHGFISPWYTVCNYLAAYTPEFHLVRDKRYWSAQEGPPVLPPMTCKAPERPRSIRIKGTMDEMRDSKENRCSMCGVHHHTKNRCTSTT